MIVMDIYSILRDHFSILPHIRYVRSCVTIFILIASFFTPAANAQMPPLVKEILDDVSAITRPLHGALD